MASIREIPSPLTIFILCMELLTRKIDMAIDYNLWKPVFLHMAPRSLTCSMGTILSSLLRRQHAVVIPSLTYLMSSIASQDKNQLPKIKNFFSKNCSSQDKNIVLSSFNMHEGTYFGKYLSFPIFTEWTNKHHFQFIFDNFKTPA